MNEAGTVQRQGPMPPALLVAAMVIMVGLNFFVPLAHWGDLAWRLGGGALLALIGLALNLWADAQFKRAGTTVKPFLPTTVLIEAGAFALSRHPMYLGMLFMLAGIALALGSLSPWLVIALFAWRISTCFMNAEESKLEATFGERYLHYKAKVRRWL